MTVKRVEGVHLERAADEILVVKPGTLEAHALNQSAAAVYELCDGKTSKSEMAAQIRRRTGLPADEEIVDLALAELVDAGLVALDDPQPAPTITRRSLIRRLALSSVAAMMLPVVETILVPPVEAATPSAAAAPRRKTSAAPVHRRLHRRHTTSHRYLRQLPTDKLKRDPFLGNRANECLCSSGGASDIGEEVTLPDRSACW